MGLYTNVLFPMGYDLMMSSETKGEARARQLSQVSGDILEIGFGTGLNLPHYPQHVQKITTVDPNPGMNSKAEKRARQYQIKVDIHPFKGEQLPFADNSFDSVVTSYTLCSVENIRQTLTELRRVLRPSGHYYFLEHGLSHEHHIQKWQYRLNSIQKIVSAGCQLNLDIKMLIREAGFQIIQLNEFYMSDDPKTHGYMYQGIAKCDV